MVRWLLSGNMESIWKEVVIAWFEVAVAWRDWRKPWKIVVLAGIRAEIVTGNLPNIMRECYQHSHSVWYVDVNWKVILWQIMDNKFWSYKLYWTKLDYGLMSSSHECKDKLWTFLLSKLYIEGKLSVMLMFLCRWYFSWLDPTTGWTNRTWCCKWVRFAGTLPLCSMVRPYKQA